MHGLKGNQDAIAFFTAGKGDSIKYTFSGIADANQTLKDIHALGISGATIDGKNLIIYDGDKSLTAQIGELSKKLNLKPKETNGTFKLITRDEYQGLIGGSGRRRVGDNLHPDMASRDGEAVGQTLQVSDLAEKRTRVGRFIERIELSPTSALESAKENAFREGFDQRAITELEAKYGSKIKVGTISISVEKFLLEHDFKRVPLDFNRSVQ